MYHAEFTHVYAALQVRIDRDAACQSISTPGLYPCGEGAGYAGGIVSAAVDGLRVGAAVVAALRGLPSDVPQLLEV